LIYYYLTIDPIQRGLWSAKLLNVWSFRYTIRKIDEIRVIEA
jgi:hypothetical protein